ncbi:vitamin B12 ABC transporter ATP-binding protein BtuD [[Erwinia] mediterraneensis]|uniref:vitamin B12 ABC transporter ATP-binding protein BtuD n=1 Tax=[Erwinia] mediterraneensis TaxID=2161819 RepID=UPI001030C572|nr:vitamin B12 ABC transporter ATP-binding protein BtuD [[Erwinia] mediterraneensis]
MLMTLKDAAVPGRLAPFSAALPSGQLLHLVGPNGAGKSTLLALLAGLLPAQGVIEFLQRPLAHWQGPALALARAWLPQQQMPLSEMPVFHYLRLHLPRVPDRSGIDDALSALLAALQLSDKLQRRLTQLSGGEWQRVRLAAVMLQIDPAINPRGKLLLLDEPMTALDIAQQKAVDDQIARLCAAGITVVTSGHDLNHSLQHAQRVWLLHQGAVVAQGAASTVLTPEQLAPLYQIAFRQAELDGRPQLMVLR